MSVTDYPPAGQMYATPADDPANACQCALCRNRRAIMPAPLTYGSNGYDQYGYDQYGYDAFGDTHLTRYGCDAGSYSASELNLAERWAAFTSDSRDSGRQEKFRQFLRAIVRDPDILDELSFCGNCSSPAWDENLYSASGGDTSICDSCWNDWSACENCEEKYPDDDLCRTLRGSDVCDRCRDEYYSYCEDCDGYYHDEYSGDHDHDNGCCNSPQPEFTVRNDGYGPLANDTRITVTLPAGTISAEGLREITRYLQENGHFDLTRDLGKLGDQWQTRNGNFTKRLSRHAYQAHQDKLTPEILSRVGCIARDHSAQDSVDIEITRDLNQSAEYFYHDDSCWWGSYSESRCALKTNGGFGLRSFNGEEVSGRAWVLPLRQDKHGHLTQTFDTMTPDAFAVFNGYGDLSGYNGARIMAHMAGWTYRKIDFDCPPMYINAGGYLIAPEHTAENYTDGKLHLSASQHSDLFHAEKRLINA